MSADIDAVIAEFKQLCARYNFDPAGELRQKARELRWRTFLKSRSNDLLVGSAEYERFLSEVFHRAPTGDELAHASEPLTGMREAISQEVKDKLRQTQSFRCRHCGRLLTTRASEHVDHIRPVAYGGDSGIENLRLICEGCNLAKSDLLDWTLGRLFDRTWDHSPTSFVRYAVLARDQSACTRLGCNRTWREEELRVSRVVPERHGGRAIFDNLTSLCLPHYNTRYIHTEGHYEVVL